MQTKTRNSITLLLLLLMSAVTYAGTIPAVKVISKRCPNPDREAAGSGILFKSAQDEGRYFVLTSEHVLIEPDYYERKGQQSCVQVYIDGQFYHTKHILSDFAYGLSLLELTHTNAGDPLLQNAYVYDHSKIPTKVKMQTPVIIRGYLASSYSISEHRSQVSNPESDLAFIPAVPSTIQMSKAEVSFGHSGSPLFNATTMAWVGMISHQALVQVKGPSVTVVMQPDQMKSQGETKQVQTIMQYSQPFAIPMSAVHEFLEPIFGTQSSSQTLSPKMQRLTSGGVVVGSYHYSFHPYSDSEQKTATFALPTEIGGGDPTGIGGGDPTGIGGGDPTGIGGALSCIGGDTSDITASGIKPPLGLIRVVAASNGQALTPALSNDFEQNFSMQLENQFDHMIKRSEQGRKIYIVGSLDQVLSRAYQLKVKPLVPRPLSEDDRLMKLGKRLSSAALKWIERMSQDPTYNNQPANRDLIEAVRMLATDCEIFIQNPSLIDAEDFSRLTLKDPRWNASLEADYQVTSVLRTELAKMIKFLSKSENPQEGN